MTLLTWHVMCSRVNFLRIECDSLVKIYKTKDIEVLALQGLDLTVKRGELMAIIGNSGSGKSTFLNMIGGLDRPSAGKLYVDGKETKIETVNTAFAGAKLSSGSHTIDLRFDPPGQKYGMMASLLSVVLFAIWSVATVLYRQKHHR